jgi:tripartite-type tricarboxylate transporter receptor subunit TctC
LLILVFMSYLGSHFQRADTWREDSLRQLYRGLVAASITAFVNGALLALMAVAQEYPTKPIRFLQGFAAGGNADIISRVIGEELQIALAQPVIYESRPGAGGNLATEAAARSEPDGHTLVLLTTGHVISAAMYKSLRFDPINDLAFISTATDIPFFFVTNVQSPFKSIGELVEAARSKAQSVTFGTAGIGTGQHLTGETFAAAIGAQLVHVPFRGDSGAVTALLSNDVNMIIAPGTAIFGNISAGLLRPLAVSSRERWQALPAVPTIAETVAPGFEMVGWSGVATAHGVPEPIVNRLSREIQRIVLLPAVDKRLREMGNVPRASTPEEMTRRAKTDIARFNGVIDNAGIPRQ